MLAISAFAAAPAALDMRDAIAALERGDFALAEETARAELRLHPDDSLAWSVLGVALDGRKEFAAAEEAHRRAVAGAPRSADILNNYANHQLAAGNAQAAAGTYRKVLELDPGQMNANVQLARLALQNKNGAAALRRLDRLPAAQRDAPAIAALRLAARALQGDRTAYDSARGNLGLSFTAGVALANAGQFGPAENFLSLALAAAPADFNVLFNLGAVAAQAGHADRACEVLEAARRQQPENVNVLYYLAYADRALGRREAAVAALARGAMLAPDRADIQKLLAVTTADLGALDDSAAAWDRYLRLVPDDDAARRERAFLDVEMGQVDRGLAGLRAYTARHPAEAEGYYELGLAESKDDPAQALPHLSEALRLQPDLAGAHAARGGLYYQMGKPEAGLPDLEAAASLRPDDADSLDRLGQTYMALDRSSDAVRVLRRASTLAPEDPKIELHFARALADAGQAAESKAAMERFRRMGPAANKAVPAGLVDYLSLTPQQRKADYRARVEKAVREHPDDATAQAAMLKLLLEEGKTAEADAAARRIAALKPDVPVLEDAARALLECGQYAAAKELLQAAGPAAAAAPELAIADFQMLDAAGKTGEAAGALKRALAAAPDGADLYRQAIRFLSRQGKNEEAARLLQGAARAHPRDREILLLDAIALAAARQPVDADRQLADIQSRWPEWPAVWLARGIVLGDRQALETASALGARPAQGATLDWLLERPIGSW